MQAFVGLKVLHKCSNNIILLWLPFFISIIVIFVLIFTVCVKSLVVSLILGVQFYFIINNLRLPPLGWRTSKPYNGGNVLTCNLNEYILQRCPNSCFVLLNKPSIISPCYCVTVFWLLESLTCNLVPGSITHTLSWWYLRKELVFAIIYKNNHLGKPTKTKYVTSGWQRTLLLYIHITNPAKYDRYITYKYQFCGKRWNKRKLV